MLKQIYAITQMSLKGIPERPLAALVTITGVATMVGVMTALLALGAGLSSSATKDIGPDMAVVLTKGSANDYMGSISREAVNVVSEAPGVKKDAKGKALVAPMIRLAVNVIHKATQEPRNINLAGLPLDRFGVVGGIGKSRITKGRLPRPGLRELVAGSVASQQYEHLKVGDRITLRGSQWSVVGEYESNGSIAEGGLTGDIDTVLPAFERNAYQEIDVQLNSPADFARFKQSIENDPRLSLEVQLKRQNMEEQLSQLTSVINFVGYFVGTVMGIGALFGILNTMYAAVDARRRDFATLRAVGFSRLAILTSITLESIILALPGAVIGAAVAWLLFDGHLGQVADLSFPITVTPGIVLTGIVWTLVFGLIGGLVPSLIAARQPIATALRST